MSSGTQRHLARLGLSLILMLWLGMSLLVTAARAAETIPHQANTLRHKLTQQAHLAWGLDAPVATFAAQIHTESRWQSAVSSPVGAHGIAQFMPATEAWINKAFPELASLGDASKRLMPETDRLGVAMDVIRRFGEFTAKKKPALAGEFVELIEQFGDELARAYS